MSQRIAGFAVSGPALAALLGTTVWAAAWQPLAAQEAAGAEAGEGASAEEEALASSEAAFVLDTLQVTAAPGTTTEDSGSWTTEWMRSATGMPLSQKETPQSTSVITDAQIRARDITSIGEALDTATGITVQAYESDRVNFYSRGFEIDSYQFDGVPVAREDGWQFDDANVDMAIYDHVEIVRGATGLMQGAGEPGASINLIRKRPTDFLRREAAVLLGYPEAVRGEIDISGPLNADGTVRGRLIGAAETRDGWIDHYEKTRAIGYGAIEVDLTERTLLAAGISHQQTDSNGVTWAGLPPWDSDLALIDWPRGATSAAPWTRLETGRTEAFAALEHLFDNGWTGRLTYTRLATDFDSTLLYLYGLPDHDTGIGVEPYPDRYTGDGTQDSLNAVLNGDFEAIGRMHDFVLGAFGSKADSDQQGYPIVGDIAPIGSFFDWDGSYPEPEWGSEPDRFWTNDVTQIGLYGALRFRATDALSLIGGARLNWWDGRQTDPYSLAPFEYDYSGIVTPYVGATYDVNETWSVYGSITSIYEPQLFQDLDRNYLDPTYGYNYELGAKAGLMDGALYAAAAVFWTEQRDVANYLYTIEAEDRSVYESIEGTTTRGFELEMAGAINERWNVSGGFTYRYSEDRDGNELFTDQPRNTLKLATDYRIPGILDDRLTVGGAMRWQSQTDSIPWEGDLPNIVQDPYAIFDVSGRYDISDDIALQLNVTNVLDEKYYRTTGFYDTVVYGDGLGAELSLRARF
ncbi:MAG TPA: TonB-dependent siderophore receptor [Amaricoccus sp.]|mgnify:CR=1 FL=1|uniref:TonB-dependent siderophore receptor n=1 Tax=Amaricoccus sp. TaxID=1872485 RepID=UPI002B901B63|nr:TonB-dependent siderophore receptor [Amaricoccus sp.]HMQ92284.1 TonB-dependent siderophore receptor [Amaricoccus sp.]HMR51049.1 TonB-dependent siderophore receptor [Amaricoccus sp.]HMR60750.1 TonB-dependent siderophore receptor [Amaricoccus sp.]HMT97772.1 TonB-dependent siderophore receptor [Amaricoccus sp.]